MNDSKTQLHRILYCLTLAPKWTTSFLVAICFANELCAFNVYQTPFGIGRWNAAPHTVDGLERSLDGGLRYSLQGGSYEGFRDLLKWKNESPTVSDFQSAVEQAFGDWESMDSATGLGTSVRFVADLETTTVPAPFPTMVEEYFQSNPGAEIDIFVAPIPEIFPGVRPDAQVFPFGDPNSRTVTLASGTEDYPAAVFAGVDIYFNSSTEFESVKDFQNLLNHEIGHALGLGDVEVAAGAYGVFSNFYDDNFDDTSHDTARETLTNSFAGLIDPFDPDQSPAVKQYDVCKQEDPADFYSCTDGPGIHTPGVDLVMEGSTLPLNERPRLQNDEFAGRQFLYPFVPTAGDFNGDSTLTVEDIDLLTTETRRRDSRGWFDLNNDDDVSTDDRTIWIRELMGTYYGDSNLDGEFNSSDLVQVFAAAEYEDEQPLNSTWATGDWNGDGDFDSADLTFVLQYGEYETGPRKALASVPEPTTFMLLPTILALWTSRRLPGTSWSRLA